MRTPLLFTVPVNLVFGFFCLTERGDFFHVECALWDHLACTALLWVGLLHVHPLPSAQSDSVSFHFPVIFTAHIPSHRQPLAWFSKASGHISPLCYYYLSILLGLCCTWLAIQIKLAMTWRSNKVTANKQPLQQWMYSECMGKEWLLHKYVNLCFASTGIYNHEGAAVWSFAGIMGISADFQPVQR